MWILHDDPDIEKEAAEKEEKELLGKGCNYRSYGRNVKSYNLHDFVKISSFGFMRQDIIT